jgi:hypothetical protein
VSEREPAGLDPELDAKLDAAAEPLLEMKDLADRVVEILTFEVVDEYRARLGDRAVPWIVGTLRLVAASLEQIDRSA